MAYGKMSNKKMGKSSCGTKKSGKGPKMNANVMGNKKKYK